MRQGYNFYHDPGHGWLEVPLSEILELGIADKITVFSYLNGHMAYLEEDQDAPLFIAKRMEADPKWHSDRNISAVHVSHEHNIRNYPAWRYENDADNA